jgi:hypothetical protein
VSNISRASSVELDKECAVINIPETDKTNLGGTMRLGIRPEIFKDDSEWSSPASCMARRRSSMIVTGTDSKSILIALNGFHSTTWISLGRDDKGV